MRSAASRQSHGRDNRMNDEAAAEAKRIERLWAGDFGLDYLDRNPATVDGRQRFWRAFIDRYSPASILEVGCNLGANLLPIHAAVPTTRAMGVDINRTALHRLHDTAPA